MSVNEFVELVQGLQTLGATYVKAGEYEVVLGPSAPAVLGEYGVPPLSATPEPSWSTVDAGLRRKELSDDFVRDNYGSSISRTPGKQLELNIG